MTTTTLSFKQRFFRLYISTLKQNLGLIFLLTAITFFFFPIANGIEMYHIMTTYVDDMLQPVLENSSYYHMCGAADIYGGASLWFFPVYVLAAPVLAACSLCRPLHNRRAADLYNSLPLSRKGMLGVWLAAGMTITAIPLFVGLVCTPFTALFLHYPHFHPLIMMWDFFLLLLALFSIMSIVMLCAVCTGTTFDCVVFSGLLFVLPISFWGILESICDRFSYGWWISKDSMETILGLLFPVAGLTAHFKWSEFDLGRSGIWAGVPYILFWAVAAFVLYGISFCYIHRRKSEMSGSLNRNSILEAFICIVLSLTGGLAIGFLFTILLFLDIEKYEWLFMILFSAIGGGLSFAITEAVLSRGFHKLKKQLAHAGAAMLAIAAVSGGVIFYCEVFVENYMPDFSQIESISVEEEPGLYQLFSKVLIAKENSKGATPLENAPLVLHSEDVLRRIYEIQKHIIEENNQASWNREIPDEQYGNSTRVNFTYHLKNGRQIIRHYYLSNYNLTDEIVQLYGQEEYIRQVAAIFNPEYESYLKELTILDSLGLREETFPNQQQDSQKFQRLLNTLAREFIAMDPNVYYKEIETPVAWLKYNYPKKEQEKYEKGEVIRLFGIVPIYASFTETINLLTEYGYGSLLELDISQVRKAVITNSSSYVNWENRLGRTFINLADNYRFSEISTWIDRSLLEKSQKKDSEENSRYEDDKLYIEAITNEELLELISKLRISSNDTNMWRNGESANKVIICTDDDYVVRFIEE